MKYFIVVSMIFVLFFGGCASTTNSVTESVSNMKENLMGSSSTTISPDYFRGKTLTFTNRSKPTEPMVLTPEKAITQSIKTLFGAGLFVTMGSGIASAATAYMGADEVVAETNVSKTSSLYLNARLVPFLVKEYGMVFVPNSTVDDSLTVAEILTHYKADYILDNYTYFWQLGPYTTHWDTYRVVFHNKLRLIESVTGNVIVEGQCEYSPEYAEGMPNYAQMIYNDGQLVREETQKAMNLCLEEFKTKLFQ